jgi:hypothetical protein
VEERRRTGELKLGPGGEILDRESRNLVHHRNNYQRLVDADEQERAAMLANEHKYREIALTNYKRLDHASLQPYLTSVMLLLQLLTDIPSCTATAWRTSTRILGPKGEFH